MSRHLKDLEKSKFKQFRNFKTAVYTLEYDFRKALQSVKTTVATTAIFINTPENSQNFNLFHNTSGATLYLGDNKNITAAGADSFPVLPGDTIAFIGKKNNNNEIYGIVASGSVDVYVVGNY